MRCERPDLTARISGEAHRASLCTPMISGLKCALLRNFYAPSARDREALLGVEETPVATTGGAADSPFRIQPRRGEKQRKAKGMFRMAKRNVSHLRHKPLKSLWALN
jgi:hypothetical protein